MSYLGPTNVKSYIKGSIYNWDKFVSIVDTRKDLRRFSKSILSGKKQWPIQTC